MTFFFSCERPWVRTLGSLKRFLAEVIGSSRRWFPPRPVRIEIEKAAAAPATAKSGASMKVIRARRRGALLWGIRFVASGCRDRELCHLEFETFAFATAGFTLHNHAPAGPTNLQVG